MRNEPGCGGSSPLSTLGAMTPRSPVKVEAGDHKEQAESSDDSRTQYKNKSDKT
ncbi:hypothetical protein QG37_00641 [Candidozyma auris]|nr:hypothetical protein QG37_00641 [[Candida] auris]